MSLAQYKTLLKNINETENPDHRQRLLRVADMITAHKPLHDALDLANRRSARFLFNPAVPDDAFGAMAYTWPDNETIPDNNNCMLEVHLKETHDDMTLAASMMCALFQYTHVDRLRDDYNRDYQDLRLPLWEAYTLMRIKDALPRCQAAIGMKDLQEQGVFKNTRKILSGVNIHSHEAWQLAREFLDDMIIDEAQHELRLNFMVQNQLHVIPNDQIKDFVLHKNQQLRASIEALHAAEGKPSQARFDLIAGLYETQSRKYEIAEQAYLRATPLHKRIINHMTQLHAMQPKPSFLKRAFIKAQLGVNLVELVKNKDPHNKFILKSPALM